MTSELDNVGDFPSVDYIALPAQVGHLTAKEPNLILSEDQEPAESNDDSGPVNCAICGRILRHPDSRARGIGPICSGIPNRVHKRYKYGTFPIMEYTCRIPEKDNAEFVLSFLKLYSMCCACKFFTPVDDKEVKRNASCVGKAKYDREVHVWNLMSGAVTTPGDENCTYGRCSQYNGLIVDGNKIVICPHIKKRGIHYLRSDAVIKLFTTNGIVTVTGQQVWDWRREQKAKREASR